MDLYSLDVPMPAIGTVGYLIRLPEGSEATAADLADAARHLSWRARGKVGLIPVPVWLSEGVFRQGPRSHIGQHLVGGVSIIGSAGDAMLICGAWWVLLGFARAIVGIASELRVPTEQRRAAAGLCPKCEYTIGYDWQKVCPECGHPLAQYARFAPPTKP